MKLRSIKKADAAKSAKYRKLKKEQRGMKKNDVAGKSAEIKIKKIRIFKLYLKVLTEVDN